MSAIINYGTAKRHFKEKNEKPKNETPPAPCNADLMKPWKEACPTPDDMDDDGARALAAAIIAKTAEDYYRVCHLQESPACYGHDTKGNELVPDNQNVLCTRHMLEMFIDESTMFDALCDIDRKVFKEKIQQLRKSGKSLPSVTEAVPPEKKDNLKNDVHNKKLKYEENYYDPYAYYY